MQTCDGCNKYHDNYCLYHLKGALNDKTCPCCSCLLKPVCLKVCQDFVMYLRYVVSESFKF